MIPPNPTTATVDSGRISFKSFGPSWFDLGVEDAYCVPALWRRPPALPDGHKLEVCILWRAGLIDTAGWSTNPLAVLASQSSEAQAMQSLMYPARLDGKGRLCCGLLSIFADLGESRAVWLVKDDPTVTIWTNFAFQYLHSRLEID